MMTKYKQRGKKVYKNENGRWVLYERYSRPRDARKAIKELKTKSS